MWRIAQQEDSAAIMALCANLYDEDPSQDPHSHQPIIEKTLAELFARPLRGKAVVLEQNGEICGYALLMAFWSNEFGGEIIIVDELYVMPTFRQQGHATQLFTTLQTPDNPLRSNNLGAIFLEVRPTNHRAMAFYQRLGFKLHPNKHLVLCPEL
ncbi:GNAT family N-acetyltransferase [Methylovulum miyakonense]|uniref:GNAT family N-acetyltransferase n=1 Tax=Methylovulum miyakonense TaxID=645578 RepID=UPI00035C75E1|nr:GNAT family N-acetyltransferase [Methylovulum miyakonense]